MGKRSEFDRKDKDFYETPLSAIMPLLEVIKEGSSYIEPCAGNGAFIYQVDFSLLSCCAAYDAYASDYNLEESSTADATTYQYPDDAEFFITNPPWTRSILHPIIDNLAGQKPTWLLFDADWMHTKQSAEYMKYCVKVVSVGCVKWFPETNQTGKDNVCWYLFDKNFNGQTTFYGR